MFIPDPALSGSFCLKEVSEFSLRTLDYSTLKEKPRIEHSIRGVWFWVYNIRTMLK